MTIRQAIDEDNQALQKLQARCPQGTSLQVSTVNAPDFFARVRAYEDTQVLVAEDGDRIVGSAAAAVRPGRVGDSVVPVGYQFQAFVDPDFRRKRLADALLDGLDQYLLDRGAVLAYCLIMVGNDPSMRLVERRGFVRHRDLVMNVLPVYKTMKPRAPVAVRTASAGDLPAVAALVNETWSGVQLHGPTTAEELGAVIDRTPGLSLDQFLVAESGGELRAVVGFWDWSAVMRVEVLAVSRQLRRLGRGLRLLGWFRPTPPMPRPGRVLRQVMVTTIGGRDPTALAGVFCELNNSMKARGVEQVFCITEPDSAVTEAMRGFFRVPQPLYLYVKGLTPDAALAPGAVFIDGVDL
ncbi:MAG: GNAT family N-acetyltransferase [Proteobacteria bacterium]|nr:GNAT family N-acetyltransferase [Pseudomonadota bacterium]MBU1741512.1 GNAT family N-acetyltransferase [Pseudomonadota bacterium]